MFNFCNADETGTIIEKNKIFNILKIPFVWNFVTFVGSSKTNLFPFIRRIAPFIPKEQNGFSFVELMVTLVVAAILLTMAIPSMRAVIQNTRITGQANDLLSDISFARSEAIRRTVNVTICKSANPTAASPTCTTGSPEWEVGRIVFIDSNSDGEHDSTETLLRIREPLDGNNTLRSVEDRIVYTRTGATTAGVKIDFSLCDTRGAAYGRQISIERTGKAVLTKPPASC